MVEQNFAKIFGKIRKPPTRLGIAILMFMMCLVTYMMRVNLSINIIAMTNSTQNDNKTLPDYGPRFNWTADEESYLLGAYFYGYMLTCLLGGILAAVIGVRNLVGYTTIASAILTALIPYCAEWSLWGLIVVRFFIGLLGGVIYPSLHNLIATWAPPDEKGKFVSSLMGGTFGTVVTWPLCGAITEHFGYAWSYHCTAIISLAVAIIWFFIVADSPDKHKRIDEKEREYIVDSLKDVVSKQSKWPPLKHLLISMPFWALLILHYGSMWGLFFLLTAAPKFMSEILKYNITTAGFISSLPYLARLIMGFVYGQIGDSIKQKGVSTTKVRKLFTISSHILPGIMLILIAFVGRTHVVCVILIVTSLGLNGAATITNLQNSQDLAPNYAGTLYGIINFLGTTPGFSSPMIVAFFTKNRNTFDEWMYIFFVGAAAYILAAIVFIIFGSGNVQYWNDLKKNEEEQAKGVAESKAEGKTEGKAEGSA